MAEKKHKQEEMVRIQLLHCMAGIKDQTGILSLHQVTDSSGIPNKARSIPTIADYGKYKAWLSNLLSKY